MYTGGDGQSHLEEQTVGAHPRLSEAQAGVIQFHEVPTDFSADWHPAPERLIFIVLDGQIELGFRDGTRQCLNAGDATLVEDTTGSGHTMRVSSATPAVTAVIRFGD
jgi:quercetin dioxygenase-like cupin family protein